MINFKYWNLYNRIFFKASDIIDQNMEKKIITNNKRATNHEGSLTEEDVSTYKNENVIFKIHSARG